MNAVRNRQQCLLMAILNLFGDMAIVRIGILSVNPKLEGVCLDILREPTLDCVQLVTDDMCKKIRCALYSSHQVSN